MCCEGFTTERPLFDYDNIVFNTHAFYKNIEKYNFETSTLDTIHAILTDEEYSGMDQIQPLIYTLMKRGYYEWLSHIVSFIITENRMFTDSYAEYELYL